MVYPLFLPTNATSSIPPDVINNHILIKLDGPTLASVGCVSSQLRVLSLNDKLWKNLCHSTWPSIDHPRVLDVISSSPSGYRSFYSNSFLTLGHHNYIHNVIHPQRDGHYPPAITQLISAVDIRYKKKVVYSNTLVTNTLTYEFSSWPFLVDFFDPTGKGKVSPPVKLTVDEDETLSGVAENLTLSWIAIDSTRKLTAQLSSLKPVLVKPHYTKGYIQMYYSTLVPAVTESSEKLEFTIGVTCGGMGLEEGELVVKGLYLQVLDMDDRQLKGWQTLLALKDGMDSGRRDRKRGREEIREIYEEHREKKRERGVETKERINKMLKKWRWKNVEELIILIALIFWVCWHLFEVHVLRRNGRWPLIQTSYTLTCAGTTRRGELVVKEVKLQVLDNDGRPLKGKDSLKVVQKAM